MTTPEEQNKNSVENNEVPKIILENQKEKGTSPEELLEFANTEEKNFKQETAEEVSKLNSVDIDQPTFEKLKNETSVENDLTEINTEVEIVVAEAKNQVGEKKSLAEMRARNISNKVKVNFQSEQDFTEANRIALKINTLIDSLPEKKQTEALKKFLNALNNTKDIYSYKELHDEILEGNKNTEQPKQEIDIVQPDYKNAISNQTLYVNGELKTIQTQYFDQPNKVKVNFGRGWEIIDKEDLSKIHQESEKVKNQQNMSVEKSTESVIEEVPLTQEDSLKEFLYTQNMSVDQIKVHIAKSPEERKHLRDSMSIEKEDYETKPASTIQEIKQDVIIENKKESAIPENRAEAKFDKEYIETLLLSKKLSDFPEAVQEKYKESVEKYSSGLNFGMQEKDENGLSFVDKTKNSIRNEYNNVMNKLGIISSPAGASDNWIYWDLGKQSYLSQNPNESSENYKLSNPFDLENQEIISDIASRHVGWEVLGYAKNNPDFINTLDKSKDSYKRITSLLNENQQNGKLHSYQLSELGKLIQENKNV